MSDKPKADDADDDQRKTDGCRKTLFSETFARLAALWRTYNTCLW
jgi:hypothetical protein